jgi:hypothetical protein
MDLGEIYGSTFALIRRTSAVALFIFLALFGVAVLYGYGNMLYVGAQAAIAAKGGFAQGADPKVQQEAAQAMIGALVPFFCIMVIFLVGITFTHVAATTAGWDAINGRPVRLGEVLSRTVRRPYWMSLIQTLIFLAIMMMIALVVAVVAYVLSGGNPGRVGLYFGGLVLIVLAYPMVATSFRVHKVVVESRGPWQGMIASIAMVKGYWWPTFGRLFLLGLAIGAVQLIIGFAMGTMKMPDAAMTNPADPDAVALALQQAKESYTWGYVLINGLLISVFFTFLYYLLTPMYVDLRARHGDFLAEDEMEELNEV